MPTLTFAALRAANLLRLPQFKNRRGEPAHSEADGSDWSHAEWLQAVMGELGELANLMKKLRRGDFEPTPEADRYVKQEVAHELADVMIYLDLLAFRLGVDLGPAVIEKFNLVSLRVGANVDLAPEPDAAELRATAEIEQVRSASVKSSPELAQTLSEQQQTQIHVLQALLRDTHGFLQAIEGVDARLMQRIREALGMPVRTQASG